jgi:hypothetical protein
MGQMESLARAGQRLKRRRRSRPAARSAAATRRRPDDAEQPATGASALVRQPRGAPVSAPPPPAATNRTDEAEQITVINGMLRGQVILKCNLKPRERDQDEVSLILWYKDNSMVPIFR